MDVFDGFRFPTRRPVATVFKLDARAILDVGKAERAKPFKIRANGGIQLRGWRRTPDNQANAIEADEESALSQNGTLVPVWPGNSLCIRNCIHSRLTPWKHGLDGITN